MDNRSIGVFDSGVGGLTAVRELLKILPNENIIYFGDTARVPYGSHDKETIIKFSKQDLAFLLQKDVKVVLVACGTVSSTALPLLREMTDVPVIGVVEATVKDAIKASKNGRILVLATAATINSHSYLQMIHKLSNNMSVCELACPLFVPLVENGYINEGNEITRLVVADYLSKVKNFNADTIILGCTHYPLIKRFILEEMGEVAVIEAGKSAARDLLHILEKDDLLNLGDRPPKQDYYVSESVESFTNIADMFLGKSFHGNINKINIDIIEEKRAAD